MRKKQHDMSIKFECVAAKVIERVHVNSTVQVSSTVGSSVLVHSG